MRTLTPATVLAAALFAFTSLAPTTALGASSLAGVTITSVSPSQTPAVVVDAGTTVTVTGTGMLGVTGVKVDGNLLSTFPALWSIVNDSILTFSMPLASALGPIPVELICPTGSAQTTIDVIANTSPTVELRYSDPVFLIQAIGLEIVVGGQPGDIAFVFGSPHLRKTSLYGFADMDLAIGNQNQSLFILATPVIGPAGYAEVTIPMQDAPAGFKVHVQDLHLSLSDGFALPFKGSNLQSGTVLF